VLLVLLHHFGVPGFRAGFIGVDIFFVISGYLITRNIVANVDGSFRLGTFYVARLRRIAPHWWSPAWVPHWHSRPS
jgi:peptidoglycan/LPS O-acetylase OafA/YrhL